MTKNSHAAGWPLAHAAARLKSCKCRAPRNSSSFGRLTCSLCPEDAKRFAALRSSASSKRWRDTDQGEAETSEYKRSTRSGQEARRRVGLAEPGLAPSIPGVLLLDCAHISRHPIPQSRHHRTYLWASRRQPGSRRMSPWTPKEVIL